MHILAKVQFSQPLYCALFFHFIGSIILRNVEQRLGITICSQRHSFHESVYHIDLH